MTDILDEDKFVEEQAKVNAQKNPKKVLGDLAKLIERSGIDITEIDKINRVNVWQGFYKDENGDAQVVDMAGIQLVPNWNDGPKWPVVQPAKPTIVKSKESKPKNGNSYNVAVILPDVQIGYRMLKDGTLDPFHDDRAMAVAIEIVSYLNPDRIINLGDLLDFAAQSKYVQEPAFAFTTQQAIDRAHLFLAEQRANAPDAVIEVLEGNHDQRLPNSIMKNAAHSFGLQRANLPKSWPVLSVPHLCRFDDLRIDYVAGYPAASTWVNDNLRCIHGFKIRSAGSTAALVVDDERVSTIFGHVHRIERQHKTRHVRYGRKENFALTPGCLCRIDGAVPSTKGAIDLLGRPIVSYENWQQGLAVVTYEPGDGEFDVEQVAIRDGSAFFRGMRFSVK
jgi:hypothetical protein